MTQTSRQQEKQGAGGQTSSAGALRNGVGAGLGNVKSSEDENGSERSSGSVTDSALSFGAGSHNSWALNGNNNNNMTAEASNLLMKRLLQLCGKQQVQMDPNSYPAAMSSNGMPMNQQQFAGPALSRQQQQQQMHGMQFLQQQVLQQQMLQQQQGQNMGFPTMMVPQASQSHQQQQDQQQPQSIYGNDCQYVVVPMQNQTQHVMPQHQQHQIMLVDPTQNIMRPLTQQEVMMLTQQQQQQQQQQSIGFPYMATSPQQFGNGNYTMPPANVSYMQAVPPNGAGNQIEMSGGNAASNIRSKYRGVSWRKRDRKWLARTGFNGKTEHLGCFQSEKMAALAVDLRRIEHYGFDHRDRLNFPDDTEREGLIKHFKKIGEFKIKTGTYNHLSKSSMKRRLSDDYSFSSSGSSDEDDKDSDEKPPPRKKKQQQQHEKKTSETGSSSDADGEPSSSSGPSSRSSQ